MPLATEHEYKDNLRDILAAQCHTHEQIDDTLRLFLTTAASSSYYDSHPSSHVDRCSSELLQSALFTHNKEYVRRQYIYSILQEDQAVVLHILAAFLLRDGHSDCETFHMMQDEGAFSAILKLITGKQYDATALHRLLLNLLCDMACIRRLSDHDMNHIDDAFILYLLGMIEELSDDSEDPYHYTIIRLLLVLNEQYMCIDQDLEASTTPTENRIIAILCDRGPTYRTFGENLILLLNREGQLGPQLLILKMLYLLFTTPATFEYFYTNDLHVLVDVIIRNLLDLDMSGDMTALTSENGQVALRHTYLRVLHPLLRNTQLARDDGHYKRNELRKMFYLLIDADTSHFAPVDETVSRLVTRCRQINWLADDSDNVVSTESPTLVETVKVSDSKNKMLGMQLAAEGASSSSVLTVAAQVERRPPVVPPPRRRGKTRLQVAVADESRLRAQSTDDDAGSRAHSPFLDEYVES